MSKVIVLLSGGLDSATCASMAVEAYGAENVIALSMGYGQKHEIELEHAKQIVAKLHIGKHIIRDLSDLFVGSKSTLVKSEGLDNPEESYDELMKTKGYVPTEVPFRNGIFQAIAISQAMIEGAEWVYCGVHASDSRNWAYPDCTPEFSGAMANAAFVGTRTKVRILTPLQFMDKSEVVAKGLKLGAPYELTRSCYDSGDISCGKCSTCIERIKAFELNGVSDPILYRK